jgi:hypothetical protein
MSFSRVPFKNCAVIITNAINPAIRLYSIAVGPDCDCQKYTFFRIAPI